MSTYNPFYASIREDVETYLTTGHMPKAEDLARQTGENFCPYTMPMFFTGNLDADFVLVHLNPKGPSKCTPAEDFKKFSNFEEYLHWHASFGYVNYIMNKRHKSPFDAKQIRFINPFDVIPFEDEGEDSKQGEDSVRSRNLQRVMDEKLQLELIPYASPSFNTNLFKPEHIEPHIERILFTISRRHRKYTLFCGKIFEILFAKSTKYTSAILPSHTFHLTKNNGLPTKNTASFTPVTLKYQDIEIRAGIANSFAQQGIPMQEYGKQCKHLYDMMA